MSPSDHEHLTPAHRDACPQCNPPVLKALGGATTYGFDGPRYEVLERFESPLSQERGFNGHVDIKCPEFTSLCPKTGQPDFATLKLSYAPNQWCVESKSLKLYLMGFRQHGAFHEACVQRIANDLVRLLDPYWLSLEGKFAPRGGIPFWPCVNYSRFEADSILTGGTFSNRVSP